MVDRAPLVQVHDRRGGRERERAVRARKFGERLAAALRRRRDLHGDEHLAGFDGRRERSEEEVRGRDRALAALPAHKQAPVECRDRRRELGRRVGVGETAADRAARANRGVRDMAGRLGHQRKALAHERVALDAPLAHHRAEADAPLPRLLDRVEPCHPVQVDHHGRLGHAHVEHRDEALTAGEQAGTVRILRQERQGLGHRLRSRVLERGRLHTVAGSAEATISTMSAGVTGVSVIRTP
jgi:hypothetical protein